MVAPKWRYIEEDAVSAWYGLAADEYMTEAQADKTTEVAWLRFYTYQNHCALVGRFQHLQAELNIDFCRSAGIAYSRRLTGGGAIIMGEDQLGICLATHTDRFDFKRLRELYVLFSKPIILGLRELGIEAGFRSRNDLEVGGRKIAGLGIYVSPTGCLQFHTSLLLDLDIPLMLQVLNVPRQKYDDKRMIRSVEQRITTIRRELNKEISMNELRHLLHRHFERFFGVELFKKPLDESEKKKVRKIEQQRYGREEWIMQHSPQPDMNGMGLKKTAAGLLRTYIALKGETIKSVLITGDFFGSDEIFRNVESMLKWSPVDRESITTVVYSAFAKWEEKQGETPLLKPEELCDAIWLAARRARAEHRFTYRGTCYYPDVEQQEKGDAVIENKQDK